MTTEPFPILFTINGSSRHELLLLPPSTTTSTLKDQIASTISTSPNAAEFLGKYRSKDAPVDEVAEIRVKWGMDRRDKALWPKETVVTEGNWEAVRAMLWVGVGRDVLDVSLKGVGKGK